MQLFRLEQNYRSTGNILAAANAIIANNGGRIGKKLWTSGDRGAPIRLYRAYNERDEAEFVVSRIRDFVARGGKRSDTAILYRSNAQSRVFEEYLLAGRIPYRVYGGLRFFERAEIKDKLAYLRLTANRDDDASFERVVNLPARGIGAKSLEIVREYAKANACSMWRAAGACLAESLGPKAGTAMHGFMRLIDQGGIGLAQIDVTRCGLTQAMQIAGYAASRGVAVANHNFTTDINTAASLHFLAAVPNALVLEYCVEPSEISRRLIRDPIRLEDGHMRVPDAPGFGVEPDMAVVEKYLVRD